jgi:mannose-1-phosphate guanylyltransferase
MIGATGRDHTTAKRTVNFRPIAARIVSRRRIGLSGEVSAPEGFCPAGGGHPDPGGGSVKAYLLAGGRGERLRPMTLATPKCLVPIEGTPLLAIWLDLCEQQGVTDVLLNISHHHEQVRSFLAARSGGPRVTLVVEDEPVGSACTVREHRDFVRGAERFWIFYADNLTDLRLASMLAADARHEDVVMTVGLFRAPDPRAAGIVQLDRDGRVVAFDEKPAKPRGDLANAGVYLARPSLFAHIPDRRGIVDFGHDVLPHLAGRMAGHVIGELLIDVGTPAALDRACQLWRGRHTPTVGRA